MLDGTSRIHPGAVWQRHHPGLQRDPIAALHDLPGVDRIRDLGRIQELHMEQGCDPQRVLRTLVSRAAVTSFNIVRPSLHDIFVRIAGPAAVEEEANVA